MYIRFRKFLRRIVFGPSPAPLQVNPVLAPFPPMVMIDTTTRCNLACRHCPNRILKENPDFVGDMDPALYRRIVDEIARENPTTTIRPFDGGEPLMRLDIEELIRYAKERGIAYVSINSNGLLLNRDRALSLLKSGLDHIEISIDAASAATYRKIRDSEKYDLLVANIEQLLTLRQERQKPLQVTVSFVRQDANHSEVALFRKLWTGRVDRVYIREWHQHNRLVEGEGGVVPAQLLRHPCPYLWDRMIIHHDGQVKFCESDWECRHPIGDVNRQSIKEIWNNDEYRRLRESHLLGRFAHPFCRDCSDWQVVTW